MSTPIPPRPDTGARVDPGPVDTRVRSTWGWFEAVGVYFLAFLGGGFAALPIVLVLGDTTVNGAIGRSERRLQSLKYLLVASLGFMEDTRLSRGTAVQSPQSDADAAKRILQAHNANMRSDVEHLLLQVWNNNVRVQTQQQVVRAALRCNHPSLP